MCERLGTLRELRGAAVVERWQGLARAGHTEELVRELLAEHYDPNYTRSMQKNFAHLADATTVDLPEGSAAALEAAALKIIG